MQAEIRGGDTFLELTVDDGPHGDRRGLRGRAVPALLARRHGRAQPAVDGHLPQRRPPRARASPSRPRCTEADADTPPEWEEVATGGTYAWHDHRVHWMDDASPSVDRGERVGGRLRPLAGADRRRRRRRPRCRAPSPTRSRCSPLPYLGLARHRRRAPDRTTGAGAACGVPAVAPRRRVARRHGRRAGPTSSPPPTAAATPCCGCWPAVALVDRARGGRPGPPQRRRRAGPGVGGLAVGLGAVPHPGPPQARAAHRPAVRRSTAPRSPSPSASASPPPTSPSPAASSALPDLEDDDPDPDRLTAALRRAATAGAAAPHCGQARRRAGPAMRRLRRSARAAHAPSHPGASARVTRPAGGAGGNAPVPPRPERLSRRDRASRPQAASAQLDRRSSAGIDDLQPADPLEAAVEEEADARP